MAGVSSPDWKYEFVSFLDFMGITYESSVSMRDYTTIGVGGLAEIMVFPRTSGELRALLRFCTQRHIPCIPIGKGSNLLVRDGCIREVIVNMCRGFSYISVCGTCVCAGAGVSLRKLLSRCMCENLGGLEFVTGIPGTVGGAVVMNAGTRMGSVSEVVKKVTLVSGEGEKSVSRNDIDFSYRGSTFLPGTVITEAVFSLVRTTKDKIAKKIREIMMERRRKQPIGLPSCGCVFKNPEGHSAGALIDRAGLKGMRIGDAMVSPVHGNFIINLGNARAAEVLALMEKIQKVVYKMYGLELIPEVEVVQ